MEKLKKRIGSVQPKKAREKKFKPRMSRLVSMGPDADSNPLEFETNKDESADVKLSASNVDHREIVLINKDMNPSILKK